MTPLLKMTLHIESILQKYNRY